MRTTPVINRQTPPTQGDFGVVTPRKGQRATNLMSVHASSGAVPPFNGRGIRGGVAQLFQHLLYAPLGMK